jgi:hypothetical protein
VDVFANQAYHQSIFDVIEVDVLGVRLKKDLVTCKNKFVKGYF